LPSAETKRPKRHRSAKIDTTEDLLDEWLTPKNNPVMQGLVSFLNVQPTQAAPSVIPTPLSPGDNGVLSSIKDIPLSTVATGDTETLSPRDIETLSPGDNELLVYEVNCPLPPKPALSEIAINGGDNDTVSPGDTVCERPELDLSSVVSLSDNHLSSKPSGIAVREQQLQVRSLTRAEDGHSANEQRTYLALWNAGNPVLGQPFRRNTIGHAGLAKMLKVDKRQTKRWIPALIEKLTIEIEIESSYATKTTYKVFDRDEIHARRLRAGYTSFVKNRGGVELLLKAGSISGDSDSVSSGDTEPCIPGDKETSMRGDNEYRKTLSPGATVPPDPGDTVSPGGGDTVSPPYKEVNSKSLFEEDSSSSEVRTVMKHLHNIGIAADDDFAHELVRRSRAVCHDVTIMEILHFTEAKARYRGIQKSLTGFLLTAVPVCLTGESFRLYRQAELARAAAERQSWIQMRSDAEQTLNSPQGREAWEIDNAESTLKWLREQQPWVFNAQHPSTD
jgi:hypothetical protein